jgi:ATP-dependent DNA ligase
VLPDGEGWLLEPKWDGWRALAHVTPAGPRIFTRHGKAHHRRLPALRDELAELPHGTVLDGELVCLQPINGGRVRCRFDRLSGFMIGPGPHRPDAQGLTVTLVAFDALAIAGADLRAQRWDERREQLVRLLSGATGVLRLTPVLDATAAVHDALVADGWEGTVAKQDHRPPPLRSPHERVEVARAIERDRMRVASALRAAA